MSSPTRAEDAARESAPGPALDAWLPDVLSFVPGPGLDDLRRHFTLLLADRLGARLGDFTRLDCAAGARLARRLGELPTDGFLRILVAPESIHRLLWPGLHEPQGVALFFERAVEAERARSGLDFDLAAPTWTALGDARVGGGAEVAALKLEDFPAVVLGDPATRHPLAAPGGRDEARSSASAEGDDQLVGDALALVASRLTDVRRRLAEPDPAVWAFTRDFSVTLVLRRGSGERAGFRSSSPERFVGRSILWNPHLPEVSAADLAEALVHEAIHTVLDMADALLSRGVPAGTRWVTDPGLYDGASRTVSPWTGRPLDVPTYVHGFLVWFGLLCFWSKALIGKSFDAATARQRMIRAGAPFMNQTALAPLEPFIGAIRGDLLRLMRSIQDDVSADFRGVLGGGTPR